MKDYLIVIVPSAIAVFLFVATLSLLNVSGCNVALLELHGELFTTGGSNLDPYEGEVATASAEFLSIFSEAEADPAIEGILVSVNSFGGSIVAGKEIADAFFNSEKPVVALVHDAADSAAYLAASGAEAIVASENSEVGAIGAIIVVTDESARNSREGVRYEVVTSAKFKSLGHGDRPLTAEERALLERDVKIMHENIVGAIAEFRDLPYDQVAALADGSSMLGEMAHTHGLVDILGGWNEATDYLYERLGSAEVCSYPQ